MRTEAPIVIVREQGNAAFAGQLLLGSCVAALVTIPLMVWLYQVARNDPSHLSAAGILLFSPLNAKEAGTEKPCHGRLCNDYDCSPTEQFD